MGSRTGNQSDKYIVTDPKCPPILETPPNNIPVIFKGSDEFPAVGEDFVMSHTTRAVTRGRGCPMNSHV